MCQKMTAVFRAKSLNWTVRVSDAGFIVRTGAVSCATLISFEVSSWTPFG
ncbi:MAG: hypothetical protein JRN12_02690 [Nitrososphaerota archaeon]|nr:hypothetical protein [Nitrososphaerota archaeon]